MKRRKILYIGGTGLLVTAGGAFYFRDEIRDEAGLGDDELSYDLAPENLQLTLTQFDDAGWVLLADQATFEVDETDVGEFFALSRGESGFSFRVFFSQPEDVLLSTLTAVFGDSERASELFTDHREELEQQRSTEETEVGEESIGYLREEVAVVEFYDGNAYGAVAVESDAGPFDLSSEPTVSEAESFAEMLYENW